MNIVRLTRNDKKVLKFLLENGRISDTDIAEKLRITKQAVGKIRSKLENNKLITSYSARIDYASLGVNVFASETLIFNHTCKNDSLQCLNDFLRNPNVLRVCKLPEQNRFHAFYGFSSLEELESFFKLNSQKNKEESHNCCFSHTQINIFPVSSIIKDCPLGLLYKMIDER